MAQNEVKLTFVLDANGMISGVKTATGEVVTFGKKVEQTGGICRTAAASCNDLTQGLKGLTLRLLGVVTAADLVKSSFAFLGDIESATLGIASSFLTGGKYIDQFSGKALNARDSLAAALQEGKSMMEELQVANFQTIATLDQLVRAYQETLPVAMNKGFNREQVKEFTVSMVQAAGAIGMSLDMLGEETRSILNGTIALYANKGVESSTAFYVGGNQVVGPRLAAVPSPAAEVVSLKAAVDALRGVLTVHGLTS